MPRVTSVRPQVVAVAAAVVVAVAIRVGLSQANVVQNENRRCFSNQQGVTDILLLLLELLLLLKMLLLLDLLLLQQELLAILQCIISH